MSRPDHGSQAVRSLHTAGIREVAAAANVSTATVSRALRGLPRVSAATRQKVISAANSLGYVASAAASELARGRGSQEANVPRGTILVVLGPAAGQPEQTGNSASDIEQLVQSVAWTHGFSVSLETCDNAGTVGTVRAAAASAAGIIVNSSAFEFPAAAGLHDALASTMVPSVEIRRGMSPCLEHSSACNVVISGAGNLGYKLAVEYLAGSGIPVP